jgi:hypothetical protein
LCKFGDTKSSSIKSLNNLDFHPHANVSSIHCRVVVAASKLDLWKLQRDGCLSVPKTKTFKINDIHTTQTFFQKSESSNSWDLLLHPYSFSIAFQPLIACLLKTCFEHAKQSFGDFLLPFKHLHQFQCLLQYKSAIISCTKVKFHIILLFLIHLIIQSFDEDVLTLFSSWVCKGHLVMTTLD